MPRVLFVFTSNADLIGTDHKTGYYLSEAAHPYHVLKEAGVELVSASPKGGAVPLDGSSIEAAKDDDISQHFLNDASAQDFVKNTKKLSDIPSDGAGFDAIFYPGGHGPMFDLPVDKDSQALIRSFYESGRPTAAVCHAPAVFTDVKLSSGEYLVKGKKVTAFTNKEEEMVKMVQAIPWTPEDRFNERGALFQQVDPWGPNVVVDGNLISGQNPASAEGVGKAILAALNNK